MLNANYYLPYRNKFLALIVGFSLLSFFIFVGGLMLGTTFIHFEELINYFKATNHEIDFIIKLRWYREIIAFCCGGMLAMGSAILQGLTRNTMLAPDLTGMTSLGCLLIVACEIFWFKSSIINQLLGTGGAALGFILCFSLTKNRHKNNMLAIILTGISISFTATTLMQLMILHVPENIDEYLHFLTGSLYATSRETVIIVLLITITTLPLIMILSHRFSVFSLDEYTCQSIGVSTKWYEKIYFLIAALLIGSSIIGVGSLGFLGIVSPNISRLMIGNRPQYVFLLSFFIGGLIYLLADTLGRCVISPAEIPAGIMANMISAPLFLFILFRYYRGQHEWN